MKPFRRNKSWSLLAGFAVAIALLSSCTNEEALQQEDNNIRITAISVAPDGMTTSRAADANGYEGMVKTTWVEGDEIELTTGDFNGKIRYYYTDGNNNGWNILNADGTTVDELVFTKQQMNEGVIVRAVYSKGDVDDAYNDVLLAEETDRTCVGQVNFKPRNDNPATFTLALGLVHTKSYITVNLTNELTGESVQGLQVVLRNADGTTIETPVTMLANSEMTTFECFAEAAYIEKFVVTLLQSDNTTTYEIPVIPLYGTDNKGFVIKANTRYPFNITLDASSNIRASQGDAAKAYGVISLMN